MHNTHALYFTFPPEKHIILYVSRLCTGDCNKHIVICHITDRFDLLICEQTGKQESENCVMRCRLFHKMRNANILPIDLEHTH